MMRISGIIRGTPEPSRARNYEQAREPVNESPEETKVAEDAELLEAERGKVLRSVRNILSAAAGRRKASLDLVAEFSEDDGEE